MASTEGNNIISDLGEKISEEQEISDLRLQLNASQQTVANLELKLKEKEGVIIRIQANGRKEIQYLMAERKKLEDQLKDTSKMIELQDAVEAAEEKANKALNELHGKIQKHQKMNQILEKYERAISNRAAEYKKLSDMHETVKGNLATLEMAFHDVIQKYERSKAVIEGFKTNEDIYKENVEGIEKNLKLDAQRYEFLKTHCLKQIEKANKEHTCLKSQFEALEMKQNAFIKRLTIKTAALEISLEQKTRECAELAALCDEVTGKKV